jgi:transposase
VRGRGEKKGDGTGGQAEQALGRSVGGFGTKVHGRFNGLGLPTQFLLTPGQTADITHADALLEGVECEVVIADKAFDKQELVDAIETGGAEAVIPSRKNRVEPREIDRERYKDRNLAERGWGQMKQFRRVATR